MPAWAPLLKNYPSSDKLWFLQGLSYGFDIECNPKLLTSAKRNCPSAYEHADVIDNYVKEEISFGWIAGPFKEAPFKNIHINLLRADSEINTWQMAPHHRPFLLPQVQV